jgi:hypothetical protein
MVTLSTLFVILCTYMWSVTHVLQCFSTIKSIFQYNDNNNNNKNSDIISRVAIPLDGNL